MRKTLAATVLGATIMGGTLAGAATFLPAVVGAQSGTTTTTPTAPGTNDADAHREEHAQRLRDALQPLVDNNTITATQRDAVVTALQDAGGGRGGHGMGMGKGMRGGIGAASEAVASALGIDTATLRTELQSGKSLADIAAARNVDVQKVIDAVVTELSAKIDEAVAAGRITAEQATERKATLATQAAAVVNATPPVGGMRGPRGDGAMNQGSGMTRPGAPAATQGA